MIGSNIKTRISLLKGSLPIVLRNGEIHLKAGGSVITPRHCAALADFARRIHADLSWDQMGLNTGYR